MEISNVMYIEEEIQSDEAAPSKDLNSGGYNWNYGGKYCDAYKDKLVKIININDCFKKKCFKGTELPSDKGCHDESLPEDEECVNNGTEYFSYDEDTETCTKKQCFTTGESAEITESKACNEVIVYKGKTLQRCVSEMERYYVKNALGGDTMCSCENGVPQDCKVYFANLGTYVKTILDEAKKKEDEDKGKKKTKKQQRRKKRVKKQKRRRN
ncbi:hypothetical protein KUTeg_020034 [Tegillarca granosa]|uniref:Uncharacterized protein n=1 Tax=Tegillarca granosa TaxID=220873 RepID=A0ABQ9EEA5_TEGGR|nr:hypothetical protein KUTeg_020034 [Tegillarca granosa]